MADEAIITHFKLFFFIKIDVLFSISFTFETIKSAAGCLTFNTAARFVLQTILCSFVEVCLSQIRNLPSCTLNSSFCVFAAFSMLGVKIYLDIVELRCFLDPDRNMFVDGIP